MKARSAITPTALVALAASTAAYAYFVDRGHVSDADREARRLDVFPSFRVEDVRRLEVVHGEEVMVLERDAPRGAWAMRSPRAGGTDAAAVDSLLRELEMAVRVRAVQPSDAVGLDAPRVRGHVVVGPVDYRFELGGDAPRPEGAAYMRVDGEGVFVAGRSLKVQLLRSADAYRDRTIVPLAAGDVARVDVRAEASRAPQPSAPARAFVLERRGASFRVGRSDGVRASRAAVDHVFSTLAEARADTFLSDAEADRVMAAPDLTVVLTPREAGSARVTLLVGGPCPGEPRDVVVVRTEPTRLGACVAKRLLDGLGATPDELVDRGAFFARADEIEEIRLESGGAATPRVDLARRGNGWHERSPEDRDLSPDEVDSANVLALALASGQAIEVRAPDAAERGEPSAVRARATIVRTGGRTTEVLELEPPEAAGAREVLRARRLDDGAILRFEHAVARRFEPHPAALRSLSPWATPIDPGSVIAVDDSCSEPPQRLELRDGAWRARGAATAGARATAAGIAPTFDVDAASAADLVSALARTRASARLTEADDGTFGFGRDRSCAVTLTLGHEGGGGPSSRVGIVFGAEDRGDVFAHDVDDPAVFTVPLVLREIASHPAVDRSRFHLDPAALSRVTLVRTGAKVVLARPGGPGDRLVRGGAPEDAGTVDRVEAALAGLYAQCALHAGPAAPAEGLDRPILEIDATAAPGARADGSGPSETRITFGAPVHESAVDGYFARVAGVDATFLVPRHLVSAILDAW